jgi:hypothetical protein
MRDSTLEKSLCIEHSMSFIILVVFDAIVNPELTDDSYELVHYHIYEITNPSCM